MDSGFRAITKFLGLNEESHIMVRRYLIQELKNHGKDYVGVYAGEDRYNYILNDLHPPTNSGGIALVDKWLTLPVMGHIVANYYNRHVSLLTNHEIGTSKSFFPLRELPPTKQKTPIMCLGLIPNHFVLRFLKDRCLLSPLSKEWNNHRSNDVEKWLEIHYAERAVCIGNYCRRIRWHQTAEEYVTDDS
ncbi:hypothetical protein MTR_5g037560 [Medicago truncatula]|uniref:Uncharacterized protein n=1 Tax=Medicago truncatula TaxID=3880 RepID=G7K8C3_MEDTR|nr:hypothetical protein MTR_5g037560 [Medicago truncatula]